jgi:hypothetical protein
LLSSNGNDGKFGTGFANVVNSIASSRVKLVLVGEESSVDYSTYDYCQFCTIA